MKIILVGYPGSQHIVPASKHLVKKYLPDFEVTYLNYPGKIEGWAEFVAHELSKRNDKHIIFSLDDYLIAGPINKEVYKEAERLIGEPVACVKLCKSSMEEHRQYPATTQYCIWDREYLISLLHRVKTPWEFELEGSRIFEKEKSCLLMPCIDYFTNSSLSGRWEGVNLSGLKSQDITELREFGLLPTETTIEDKSSTTGIVVFGGSGYLGAALVERLISKGNKNITVVARNEGNLVKLKEMFPAVKIMVGDIADAWIVKKAMAGADEVYLLSAMKHVGLAEHDVQACINTNIVGTSNVIKESLITKPSWLVFISSDKAAQSTGVYGCTKKIGERLMVEAEKINSDTDYRVVRYGNVWASTGSIATKWKPKMEKGEEVIITDRRASRFFWTVDEAVDLIFEGMAKGNCAEPYIPKMKAVTMGTVLDACLEVWGNSPVKEIGLQPGENLVETTDGKVFSDTCEQFTKEEFQEKFLIPQIQKSIDDNWKQVKEIISNSKPKVSAVLITKDEIYPSMILDRLDLGFFDEIIVVPDCKSIFQRYAAASGARNQVVYVQDDDAMVNYQELFKHYNGRITNAMTEPFQKQYEPLGCTLVGWGCFFPKSMVDVFVKYVEKYGQDDEHLHREADRIFTAMNAPFNTVIMPHEDLPAAREADRMSYHPEHYVSAAKALEKVKAL